MSVDVEAAIFQVLGKAQPGKSVSPEDVARSLDPEGWRRLLGHGRAVSRGLARQGRLVVTRHGKPADPEHFKGVYRLKLPDEAAVAAPGPEGT